LIFTHLELTDFMKIKHAKFDLDADSMVILQGANGQGKSAVFEAMALILTGHRKGSSFKHYIRRGQKKFHIKATMYKTLGGEPYEVEMVCSHTSMPPMNKTVTHKGNIYKNSEYETFISSHFDADLISNITMTMQGDNNLAHFKPSQLRDLLKSVFKISFEKEQEKTREVASHYREKERSLIEKISSYKESLEILKRDEPILYRPPSQVKIDEKRTQLDNVKKELNDLQTYTAELDTIEKDINIVDQQRNEKKRLLDNIQQRIDHTKKKVQVTEQSIKVGHKHLNEIEQELSKFSEADELTQAIERLTDDIASYKSEKQGIEHKLQLIDKGDCPTCRQPLPSDWVSNYNEFKQELEKLSQRLKESDAELRKQRTSNMERTNLENKKRDAERDLETQKVFLKQIQDELEKITNDNQWGQVNKELEDLNTKYGELVSTIDTRRSELSDYLTRETQLIEQQEQLTQELNKLENDKRTYEAKAEILKDNHERKEQVEKALKDFQEEEVGVHRNLEVYEVAEKLVDKYLPTFGVLTAGEKVVQGMLNIIKPVIPSWDIRLAPSRDGVYFEYRESGEDEYSPISMASGFENSLCNIAFKMTLTAYYGLPLMILDEVDAAAVDENSYRVFDSIIQFKRAYQIHQIWLVSHKKDVVAQLIQEYGESSKVFHVEDGNITTAWVGGATQ